MDASRHSPDGVRLNAEAFGLDVRRANWMKRGCGFRHPISTAPNVKGYHADWIERQLAHGDPNRIRGIYNKAPYMEERRAMMQAWADEIDAFRSGKGPGP